MDEAASDLSFDEALSASAHIEPPAPTKHKKQAELPYHFPGIERLSSVQLGRLAKLHTKLTQLRDSVRRLHAPQYVAPVIDPELAIQAQQAYEQVKRGVNPATHVKAACECGGLMVMAFNPQEVIKGRVVGLRCEGLKPSKVNPDKVNLQQVLSGEQEHPDWPLSANTLASLSHATDEQWALIQAQLPLAVRKDKAPKVGKPKRPRPIRKVSDLV